MKLLGTVMLSFCVVYSGIHYSAVLKKRVGQLDCIIAFLEYLKKMLRNYPDLLQNLLQEISGNTYYQEVDFIQSTWAAMEQGISFSQSWLHGIKESKMLLLEEDWIPLKRLSKALGQLDLVSQIESIESAKMQLQDRRDVANKQVETQSALYRTLGICGGIALFIIMI